MAYLKQISNHVSLSITTVVIIHRQRSLISGGAYITNLGSRKNCVLIFGHCYRCVLAIDRKWKIDVAIFSVEPL